MGMIVTLIMTRIMGVIFISSSSNPVLICSTDEFYPRRRNLNSESIVEPSLEGCGSLDSSMNRCVSTSALSLSFYLVVSSLDDKQETQAS
jgi:hypothetical protein